MFAALALTAVALALEPRPDIVVANFDGPDFPGWTATGTAFGTGPARGTLPNQMQVEGFRGAGYVSSFHGGDDATGTLTSPAFVLERKYLNFLIGGGKHSGQTCAELLIDGNVVAGATGPNDKPGGSERLDWQSFDVSAHAGKTAVLRLTDSRRGGWGHVTADEFTLSDTSKAAREQRRELRISKFYLLVPVYPGQPTRRVTIRDAAGVPIRDFDLEVGPGEPAFFSFTDVGQYLGQTATISATLPADCTALDKFALSAERPAPDPARPKFHFAPRRGWLNDPNGLFYLDGEWHLYHQHNPYGTNWGNMHWGHAVSRDLLTWEDRPVAIYPKKYGDWAFSGSAVVDHANTSGFGTKDKPAVVAAFTSTGRGECIVYSRDKGETWHEFEGNPVVKHAGRDPKLSWHEPTKRWVMAVYDETKGQRAIAFYTSPDLKAWEYRSKIDGFYECPDLIQLKERWLPQRERWVLYAADGKYLIGDFDGVKFTPKGNKQQLWHGRFYAAQTFSNAADGRCIQIGWAQGVTFPGKPFNQQMTIPVELTLEPSSNDSSLSGRPVRELDRYLGKRAILAPSQLGPQLAEDKCWDIRIRSGYLQAGSTVMSVCGHTLDYNFTKRTLTCGGVTVPVNPDATLRIVVDRGSIEIFVNVGEAILSVAAQSDPTKPVFFGTGTPGVEVEVRELALRRGKGE